MSDQERLDRLEAEGLAMHTPESERQIAETMAERERGSAAEARDPAALLDPGRPRGLVGRV